MVRKSSFACAWLPAVALLALPSPAAAQDYEEMQALAAQLRETGQLRPLDAAAMEITHALLLKAAAAMVADDQETALAQFAAIVAQVDARPPGTPAYFEAYGAGRTAFYIAILDEAAAARERGDWQGAEGWTTVAAAASLGTAIRADGAAATAESEDFARHIAAIAYSLAMQGDGESLDAFLDGIFAVAPEGIDRTIALELAGRASSLAAFGEADRGRAGPFAERLAASFARAGIAAESEAAGMVADVLGRLALEAGEYDDAETQFAADGAIGRDTAIQLAFLRGDIAAGIAALLGLEAPPDPEELTLAQAEALAEFGPNAGPDGQLALYALALPIYERALPEGDMQRLGLLQTYARALLDADRPAEAETLYARLLRFYETRYSLDTSGGGDAARGLAQALEMQSRYDEAGVLYRQLWEIGRGYGIEGVAPYAEDLAGYLLFLSAHGDRPEAERLSGQILAEARRAPGMENEDMIRIISARARILADLGNYEEAAQLAREAVALDGPDSEWRVAAVFITQGTEARRLLAQILEADGRAGEAEPIRRGMYERVLANQMIPREGELHRESRLELTRNLAAQGRREADALFLEAITRSERIFGPTSPQTLAVADPFARYLVETGRPEEALSPARRALAARIAATERAVSVSGEANRTARALERRNAARTMVRAAWSAARTP